MEHRVKTVERTAYVLGALLILSGLIHFAVLLVSGGSWEGPLSFRKPMTFGLSFGLTLINVTLIASLVSLADRTRTALLAIFASACVLETFLVSLQAWRDVPSHFNIETPFDAMVARLLAVGGFALVSVIVALTAAALRDRTLLPTGLRYAIRAGFLALLGAQVTGAAMIVTGMRMVFGGHPQLAYAAGGWLKPVHAALMHGILVLPLFAWQISRTRWDERFQLRAVWTVIALYAAVVVGTVITSVLGAR
jgi:hypothetical protein